MNRFRARLALWYALATLLAQGVHDHRETSHEPVAVAIAGCDDPRPHYSGHSAPDLSRVDVDCPACQFRADHQATTAPVVCLEAPGKAAPITSSAHLLRSAALPRSTCRAPPLV